eukprot:12246976-Prorocentrum_lima.AAC.1
MCLFHQRAARQEAAQRRQRKPGPPDDPNGGEEERGRARTMQTKSAQNEGYPHDGVVAIGASTIGEGASRSDESEAD